MNKKPLSSILFVFGLIFLVSCATPQRTETRRSLYELQDPSIGPLGSVHEHTALLIFINGNVFDLSKPEYMVRSKPVHIENLDGTVIHKHATGITIGHFLETLGISFDKNCLVDDNGGSYCNNEESALKFYVNGNPNNEFNNYIIKENDRVLITYGTEDEDAINGQLNFMNSIKIDS